MRIEHDSLGPMEVPSNAYYGIQSLRAAQNFQISGTKIHPMMIRSLLLLKKSAAIANFKSHALDKRISQAIVKAINSLLSLDESTLYESGRYFIVDTFQAGAGTSQNMNINEVVANIANESLGQSLGTYSPVHPNNHVNMSQSTNDVYPTSMRLATLNLSIELVVELTNLSDALKAKALEFDSIIKAGRTHLQDAVPIRLGQEFEAYSFTIDQLIEQFILAQQSLRILGIGGSAVGTGLNVPKGFRQFIILELQEFFNDKKLSLSANMISAMQSQLPMMTYSNALRSTCLELTRIMNDLRLLSSGPHTGLAEIILPASQPGSSIMPGKINPSILEMGNQVFYKVLGNDHAMSFANSAGQLELNVMMPLMAHLNLESTHLLKNAIRSITQNCILGIKANVAQCEKFLSQTTQIITVLNPLIGYEKASEIIKEALVKNKTILEILNERNILSEEQLKSVLNLREQTISQ